MEPLIKTEVIEKFMRDNKIGKTAFCKLCRIGSESFSKVMRGEIKMRVNILLKIARALNVRISELLN